MATQTALIIGQDGTFSEVEYAEKDSLKTLQAAVGGYITGVDGYGFGMDAYANDEGLYTPGLTVNLSVYHVFGVKIVGNVVIPRVTDHKRARLRKLGFAL